MGEIQCTRTVTKAYSGSQHGHRNHNDRHDQTMLGYLPFALVDEDIYRNENKRKKKAFGLQFLSAQVTGVVAPHTKEHWLERQSQQRGQTEANVVHGARQLYKTATPVVQKSVSKGLGQLSIYRVALIYS